MVQATFGSLHAGYSPSLALLLGQLAGGGTITSTYFYLFYVFRPIIDSDLLGGLWVFDNTLCLGLLPSLGLCYYLPLMLSYFHPGLEERHWWNWIWQFYPVWTGISLFGFSLVGRCLSIRQWLKVPNHQLHVLRSTFTPIAIINTLVYWYTLSTSAHSFVNMIFPVYLSENPIGFEVVLRTIIQYDYICSLGGALIWVAYCYGDLKAAGTSPSSWFRLICIPVIIATLFGSGNLLLFAWLKREEALISRKEKLKAN